MIIASLVLYGSLFVPAFTAYSNPNEEGIPINDSGAGPWNDASQSLVWIGDVKQGMLTVSLKERSGNGSYRMSIDGVIKSISPTQSATFEVRRPGYRKLTLKNVGNEKAVIEGLQLDGTAMAGARFNLKPRRNAASVHLKYPIHSDEQVEWFYNEIRPKTDPIYTYYEACGWHRGYFGIQVNSPTERRVIFSVWDSGNEAVDRDKVGSDDRVRLLEKGSGVVAGDFGNEGTGGHSHLVYPWKTNEVQRFLVHAEPSGTATVYTGYYYLNDKQKWMIIAKFRAPKDGKAMHGLYSFVENFGGSNGDRLRRAEFGPVFLAGRDNRWRESLEAQFSCDATGKNDRFDYASGAVGNRWFLSNGGAIANGIKFGDKMVHINSPRTPQLTLPPL